MELLLLGTIHLESTTDAVQMGEVDRKKLGNKQFEELVNVLQEFEPEQIFVEFPMDYQPELDRQYKEYINENGQLNSNEVYQIGFRLAKKLNHSSIYTVDWNEEIANLKGLEDITEEQSVKQIQNILNGANIQMEQISEKLKGSSIIELFKFINSKEQSRVNHQIYVDLLQMSDEIAFDWVVNYWYYRNLKIVKNIMAVKKDGLKKGLIIYGAGHNYLLSQFLGEIEGITVRCFGDN
ncbi:hypothetical protein CSE16_07890 [Solibacillus sp. R5-41]|uniref:DUF5694 domain-containing protein n=1 Tax=Solibacillus sp. R5-41 TaxID=2048654 RepID=UPI000C126E63|nr:DUF5694 domain-containing protein [Solibacillus sp. R5-41]ATP39976.1 hypothetical protein CSE16_07890 [Solibacillus sp. R5-41]